MRRVQNGGGQQGAEHAAVGNGEVAALQLVDLERALARAITEIGDVLLDLGKALGLGVAQDRHDQPAG